MRTARACSNCKLAHTACDSNRPCGRCAALGKGDTCVDVERKKRGRPKQPSAPRAASTSSTSPSSYSTNTTFPFNGDYASRPSSIKIESPSSTSSSFPASYGSLPPEPKRQRTGHQAQEQTHHERSNRPAASGYAYSGAGLPRNSPTSSPSSSSSSSSPITSTGPRGVSPTSAIPGGFFGEHEHDGDRVQQGFGGTPMLESVLAMLVEEVKELRHTTQQLRDEHMLLANEVAALQQRQAEHEAKSNLIGRNNPFNSTHFAHAQDYSSSSEGSPFAILNTGAQSAYPRMGQNHSRSFLAPTDSSDSPDSISPLTSTTSISPTQQPSILSHFHPQKTYPQTSSTVMPRQTLSSPSTNSTAPTLCTRREIINYLPFLSSYPINNLDAPFAIDDLAKPFAAVRRVSGVPGEWEHSPPIFVFANTAFCAMVKYPLNELLGCPLSKVMFPDEDIKRKMSPYITQKTSYPLSELIYHTALCVTKEGKIFRFPSKYQICYSEYGQARWGIICGTGEDIEPVTFEANIPGAASAASFFARERNDPTALGNLQWGRAATAANGVLPYGWHLDSRGNKMNGSLIRNARQESMGTARITEIDSSDSSSLDLGTDTRGNPDMELLNLPSPLQSDHSETNAWAQYAGGSVTGRVREQSRAPQWQ